ncbi:MAG: hypothetical protein E7609_04715 [Ruminococcaceae bacterium]|nr:hypothetical protein [Oscillospiraceae bacterium]
MLGAWSIVNGSFTTVGAHLSAALAERLASYGKRVLLFELSPSCPTLDIFLGVSERVVYTLSDVRKIPARDVALKVRGNLYFVPIAVGETANDVSCLEACAEALAPDVILLSAERSQILTARRFSDGMLLLTDATHASLRSAAALALEHAFDGFVLADFVPNKQSILQMPPLTEICDTLGLPLFGILPRIDQAKPHALQGKDFLFSVRNMAGRLLGEERPLLCGISVAGMRKRTFFTRTPE